MPARTPQKLYPMRDFGVVTGLKTTLRVQRFADRLVPLIPFPHKHNFYHLLLVTSGRGWHEIDFTRYPLERGRVYLMKPAQVHSWQLEKKPDGFVIEFEEEFFKNHPSLAGEIQSLLQTLPDSFAVTDKAEFAALVDSCESLIKEYEAQKSESELLASLEMFAFLVRLSRVKNLPRLESAPSESFANRFIKLIEEHYQKHHDVEFYAAKLNITAKALTMKMTRLTGKAARTLIQERLILEARRLLAYSDLSVSEIAAHLGFEDTNYFSRFFRLKTGRTPGDFRKKAKLVP